MHPNTRIRITKFIHIQEEIRMETKYLFSFLVLMYQTHHKMNMTPIFFYIYIYQIIQFIVVGNKIHFSHYEKLEMVTLVFYI